MRAELRGQQGAVCVQSLVFFLVPFLTILVFTSFSFPIAAAVLSSSSPHWVMVCLAHHKAPRALPTIVCAVRPVMLWWFAFGRTCIAGRGGWVWATTVKAKETRAELVVYMQAFKAENWSSQVSGKKRKIWFDRTTLRRAVSIWSFSAEQHDFTTLVHEVLYFAVSVGPRRDAEAEGESIKAQR